MVFLAFTQKGLEEALELAKPYNGAVWCTSDAITEMDFDGMKESKLTRFDYSFSPLEIESVRDAIQTIQEHHPGERVWVEGHNEL